MFLSVQWSKWADEVVEKFIFSLSTLQKDEIFHQRDGWQVYCSHVEKVKSYAPRIDHMVADIYVGPVVGLKSSQIRTYSVDVNRAKMNQKTKAKKTKKTKEIQKDKPQCETDTTLSKVKNSVVHLSKCQFHGEELEQIRRLFNKTMTSSHPSVQKYVRSTIQREFLNEEIARKIYATKNVGTFWVAETNGEIIGCIGLRCQSKEDNKDESAAATSTTLEIKHLCVDALYRGKGIGARLVNATVHHANVMGMLKPTILAETIGSVEMEAARRLYVRLSFQEQGRKNVGKGPKKFELIRYVLLPSSIDVNQTFESQSNNAEMKDDDRMQFRKMEIKVEKESQVDGVQKHNRTTDINQNIKNRKGGLQLESVSATLPSFKTGSMVLIQHLATGLSSKFLIECLKRSTESTSSCHLIKMAPIEHPYSRVTVTQTNTVKLSSKSGKASVFAIRIASEEDSKDDGVIVQFESVQYQKKSNRGGTLAWCLGLDPISTVTSSTAPFSSLSLLSVVTSLVPNAASNEKCTLFRVLNTSRNIRSNIPQSLPIPLIVSSASASASGLDLDAFVHDGYIRIQKGVNQQNIERALSTINRALGVPETLVRGGVQQGTGKLDGHTAAHPALLDLLLSTDGGALQWVEKLMGRGKLRKPNACQIALRFPEDASLLSEDITLVDMQSGERLSGREWHVDGMRQGKRNPFSLLLGVALSACPAPYRGNLTVFPGSHRTIHSLILNNGRLRGVDEHRLWSVATDPNNPWCASKTTTTTTSKNVEQHNEPNTDQYQPPLPDLGSPKQLVLEPGDIILAHPKLAHRGAPNLSSNIRYMIYFRLKHIQHGEDAMQEQLLSNMYSDLECVAKHVATKSMTPPSSHSTSYSSLPTTNNSLGNNGRYLTAAQLLEFKTNGVLVVPNVLTAEQVSQARSGLAQSLLEQAGVDTSNNSTLLATCCGMNHLSTTNGAGGVLDLYYDEWKLKCTLNNQKYADCMLDLYNATYAQNEGLWTHPYGEFDTQHLWAHVDRIGVRLPDALSAVGNDADDVDMNEYEDKKDGRMKKRSTSSSRKRQRNVQRSLTPHFDCCPDQLYSGGGKDFPRWRPIQCMLSLTDTLSPNEGGFECAKGFHHLFNEYYQNKKRNGSGNNGGSASSDLPCVGDYIHVHPNDDSDLMQRIQHVNVPAGAAVFWDQRIPHSNSYRNDSTKCREVIYGGFLPRGVDINDRYAKEQYRRLVANERQPDFWTKQYENRSSGTSDHLVRNKIFENLSDAAKDLLR